MADDGLNLTPPEPPKDELRGDRFAIVPEWVLYHGDLSDGAVRLYAVLQRFVNQAADHNEVWPGQETLADRMRRSVPSIKRHVRELRDVGALRVIKRRRNGTTVYELVTIKSDPPDGSDLIPLDAGRDQKRSPGRDQKRSPNENKGTRATKEDPRVKEIARSLAVLAFEQEPKPLASGGFLGVMSSLKAALKAGRTEEELRTAISRGAIKVWSAGGISVALDKTRGSRRPDDRIDRDRGGESGQVFL